MRNSGIILIIIVLSSCSNSYRLTSSRDYCQGKAINDCIERTDRDFIEYYSSIDRCEKYCVIHFLYSTKMEQLEGGGVNFIGERPSLIWKITDIVVKETGVFRGVQNHYIGTWYRKKSLIKKDLKDWKRILCTKGG